MLLSLAVGCLLAAPPAPFDFYAHGPYAAAPRPESILGYGPGERQTTFREQELVIQSIVRATPDRAKLIPFGKSVEGRPLKLVALSSPRNIARLDQIQKDATALAETRTEAESKALRERIPAIVWINQGIHGNEPASFESAMWLIYNLAASKSPTIERMLENTLVLVNPTYNPDGHERFAVWSNSVAVGNPSNDAFEQREPRLVFGRVNHYRFDMNRDRVAMSQAETRQEVAEFLRWRPHVYVDQHGQTSSYFFPPNPMAVNANVDRARLARFTDVFGRANAKAFDAQGWQYYVRDIFDLYYAGYLDSWTSLSGAIGMTYETDGGYALGRRRSDGTIVTLRDGIEKHFVAALATIDAAAVNRAALIQSCAEFALNVTTGRAAGAFQRVVLVSEDPRPLQRLARQLQLHGIRSHFTDEPLTQPDAHDYWSPGPAAPRTFPKMSLVVDMAQAQGAVAKSLLEPKPDFEPEFIAEQLRRRQESLKEEKYPSQDGPEFYDFTGWCLVYAHNLKGWWCETAPPFKRIDPESWKPVATPVAPSVIGWFLAYRDDMDALAAFDLLERGVRVQMTPKEMKLGGDTVPVGSFLVLASRNEGDTVKALREVALRRGVTFRSIPTGYPDADRYGPGSETTFSLKPPKIAVVFGSPESPSDFGATWYLMEQVFNLPFTAISSASLNRNLSAYTAIVFPSGQHSATDRLKTWVNEGGVVVAMGNVTWANTAWPKLDVVKLEKDKEPGEIPGSLFRANLNPRSFLSWGYRDSTISVPVDGSQFFKAKAEGGAAVQFSSEASATKLLSGWAWPDDSEKALQGAVWLHDQPVGSGHVVIFNGDPASRAMWPGLHKLLLNAILIGPSQ